VTAPPGPGSRILGLGSYVPARVVDNTELERTLDTTDAWIRDRTGIARRHVAADHEATSDLAVEASRRALGAAGVDALALDLVIVATVTADSPLPSCAVHVQRALGARRAAAFDVSAACAGFLFGLSIADRFVASGAAGRVLVVGAEILSRIVDWSDRATAILFGDAAGAAVVGGAAADGRGPRLLSFRLGSDGRGAAHLSVPGGGSRAPLTPASIAARDDAVHMNGRVVFHAAVRNMVAASREALAEAGLAPADVDRVVAHQANVRIVDAVAERLGVPRDRFVVNLGEYGNTSSASIPLALDEAARRGEVRPGDVVLLCALGAGFAWAAAVLRF
jgi:3-oxoacyl-[acyl-carrier-protein] synthase-3